MHVCPEGDCAADGAFASEEDGDFSRLAGRCRQNHRHAVHSVARYSLCGRGCRHRCVRSRDDVQESVALTWCARRDLKPPCAEVGAASKALRPLFDPLHVRRVDAPVPSARPELLAGALGILWIAVAALQQRVALRSRGAFGAGFYLHAVVQSNVGRASSRAATVQMYKQRESPIVRRWSDFGIIRGK